MPRVPSPFIRLRPRLGPGGLRRRLEGVRPLARAMLRTAVGLGHGRGDPGLCVGVGHRLAHGLHRQPVQGHGARDYFPE
eukprot:7748468-Lingulodinium_polyedra.AAC.1